VLLQLLEGNDILDLHPDQGWRRRVGGEEQEQER